MAVRFEAARDVTGRLTANVASAAQAWLRRYRRQRTAKSRSRPRQVYALTATLLLLLAAFGWCLAYLAPQPSGSAIRLDQLAGLAGQQRVAATVFRDQDKQIVGSFVCLTPGSSAGASAAGRAGTSAASASASAPAAGSSVAGSGNVPFTGPSPQLPACPHGLIAPPLTSGATSNAASTTPGRSVTGKAKPAPKAASAKTSAAKRSGGTSPPSTSPAQAGPSGTGPAAVVWAGTGRVRLVPFHVAYPSSDVATAELIQLVTDSGASVTIDSQTRKAEVRVVTTIVLPLLILANVFVLLFAGGKGASSGIGDVELFGSIGKGGLRRRRNRKAPITFADVAGADEALEELKEVRDYLADPARYKEVGAQPPKGVLLIGPPGCGKTLLAKAVAGEVGVPFFSVAGAEFVESLVGVGAARVRDLFRRVRAAAPAVVFIDELDAAGRRRAQGGGAGGNEEREQTLNQILVEMDGFDVSSGIVVMGATNRPDILDPALLRPGRFDRHVTVDRPDMNGRTRILELHARGKPFSPDVDFAYIARRTPGFSGADLANVVNEAALLAVRANADEIDTAQVEDAIQRTLIGTVRKGRVLTPEERKRVAYHESGHVIVAAAIGKLDEVHRVTILAAGRTVGSATVRADAEAAVLSRGQLMVRLITHLAGVAAEELVFGEPSTGSEQDLENATLLARDMIARYGMNERLGRMRLLSHDVDEFLDAEAALGPVSGMTHQDLDTEVRKLLGDAEREASKILSKHRDTLNTLAARLETEETLEGPDLEGLVALVRPEVEMFASLLVNEQADPSPRRRLPASATKER